VPPFVHHPAYRPEITPGHPVAMNKYQRLAEVLVEEGLVAPGGFHAPELASVEVLSSAHEAGYAEAALAGRLTPEAVRRIGLPMTPAILRRSQASVGGTLLAGRLALKHGVACNTAGGSHHAGKAHGAGYCLFNDVAVAAATLLAEGAVGRVLVVDLDVHQGDGTAEIFADEPRVFTFSMHAAKNFPARKVRGDLDVELEDGVEDDAYLGRLAEVLPGVLDAVRPDLVFYNAGVDPHREDRLGRLALSDDGLARRDAYVLEAVLSRGAPLAGVLGGGYGKDVDVLARRHATLHRAAAEAWARWA
jgi:acetoin utilization deacetylase AcuC-like enzyme